MGLSRVVSPHGEHKVTAPSALVSGQPFQATETGSKALIYQGLKSADSGGEVTGVAVGTFEFPKASATAIATDTAVDWDATNKVIVATTTGDFALGKLRGAAAAGKTTCRVEINA